MILTAERQENIERWCPYARQPCEEVISAVPQPISYSLRNMFVTMVLTGAAFAVGYWAGGCG